MPKHKPTRPTNVTPAPAQELLQLESEHVMKALIKKALRGNVTALRLCVERLIPIPRERALGIKIPAAENAVQITIALEAVLQALGDGQLTASEAQKLAHILENQRKAIE